MRKKIFSLLIVYSVLWGVVACSTDDKELVADSVEKVSFSTNIRPMDIAREIGSRLDKHSFTDGDKISLSIVPLDHTSWISHEMTNFNGEWKPAVTWDAIGDAGAVFTAFYPTLPSRKEETYLHSVRTDQRDAAAYLASDLLIATTETQRGEKVNLLFTHAMSRIALILSPSLSFSAEELASAVICVRAVPSVTYDIKSGLVSALSGMSELLTFHYDGNNTYYLVLPPQPVHDTWHERWIEIQIADREFVFRAPEFLTDGRPFKSLEPGRQLTLRLSLKENVEECNEQTLWTYGLNHMPLPQTWGYAYVIQNFKTCGLKWNQAYGWYDCDKENPVSNYQKDSEMCWAASVANILHWWLDQNAAYIERYERYTGPSVYENSLNSDIFQYFKDCFPNEGYDVASVMNWFITGRSAGFTKKEGGAFFADVFGKNQVVSRITRFSERSFPDELKQAFNSREAVECTIRYPSGYLHAINIWGASFDENEEVTYIYITDNNDRSLSEQSEQDPYLDRFLTPAGMLQKRVKKGTDGYYYMEGSNEGDFGFCILELNILGLMQERWEQFFLSE